MTVSSLRRTFTLPTSASLSRLLLATAFGLSAFSLAAPSAHAATSQDTAAARSLAGQGMDAFRAENYEESLRLFSGAEELFHAPVHLLYIARSHAKLGHPVEAFEIYSRLAREKLSSDAPDAFVQAQEQARAEIEEVEPLIAHVTLSLEGEGAERATLFVDDVEVPAVLLGAKSPLNPGEHVLSARGDGVSATPLTITVEPGSSAKFALNVELGEVTNPGADDSASPLDEEKSGSRVPAYVALGVGGAGLVVGGVFGGLHFGKKGKAASQFDDYGCEVGCTGAEEAEVTSLDKSAATFGTVAWVGLGVGVAGLATGVTLLVLQGGKSSEAAALQNRTALEDRPHVRPYFGFGELGLTGKF